MQTQTLAIEAKKEVEKVPDSLVFEIAKGGKPIYYKGYKDVLNGRKTFEEIRLKTQMLSWLKAQIACLFTNALTSMGVEITAGELALKLPHNLKRGADIAIFSAEKFVLVVEVWQGVHLNVEELVAKFKKP